MKHTLFLILVIGFLNCLSSQKKSPQTNIECDNTKLVNYVYPISNFVKEKKLIYSLKSNRDAMIELFEKSYVLNTDTDSLLIRFTKNSQEKTTDSIIFSLKNGIPKILKSFTKVDSHPYLIPTNETITGNQFCEFSTFGDISEYKISTENGEVFRKFDGHTTHKEYVKKEFNGVKYNCAIFESKKTLIVKFRGITQELKGTWVGCACENIGELYSTTKTEDGYVIESKLEKIIEK
ncbi:hypothetical protein [Aquimarina mytili]|uniref:Uncharacterized protein n=1 Tax=Aquimarina mytili TaxID=874423 RepID=A0A936ZV67_9FLAO|nr:hypothetical protein [Aquimarina mytili]MBL0685982.1 hypothetical protein [Aquimarina mytili]